MPQQESVQEQIKWLQEQLEAKQKELAQTGEQKHERDILKEVVRDISAEKIFPGTPPTAVSLSDDDTIKKAQELQEKEHEHIIEELVAIALTKSIFSAIAVAKKLKNPHLLDDFHDALVDHYYDKLIQARKIS
ncbi:MAG TPA: hypothetical protein VJC20_01125 [Candidatus Paceibacterota bacterium]